MAPVYRARGRAVLNVSDTRAGVITGAGHGPGLEQTDPVNARITAFVAAHADQARR